MKTRRLIIPSSPGKLSGKRKTVALSQDRYNRIAQEAKMRGLPISVFMDRLLNWGLFNLQPVKKSG